MAMDLMSGSFVLPDGSRFGKNIIFGVDMSSSVYIDNKGKKQYIDYKERIFHKFYGAIK